MMRFITTLLCLLALIPAPARPVLAERPATVFAAASLSGVLDNILSDSTLAIRFSYAGSGTLARQIAAGAPADLLILANADWMDWLAAQGRAEAAAAQIVATGRLVLIAPAASPLPSGPALPEALGPSGRLAMGHRAAVPAGVYARQWLQAEGLWSAVEHRLAETDNVRAALALVAQGAAPLGVVYASDAQSSADVRVVAQINPARHAPVRYTAAALTDRGHALLDHLTTPAAQAQFAAAGFSADPPLAD